MKQLRQTKKWVIEALTPQFIETDVEYVESPYLIKDGNAVYNSLTDEAVLIEDLSKEKNELIKRWFYVPKGLDVKTLAYIIRQKRIPRQERPKGTFIIFTTTACNAHCKYCFEEGFKILTMSEETANDVADYIVKVSRKDGEIKIKWFGGEPLLNKKVMNIISEKIRDAGIKYWCEISTNGDLLPSCTDDELRLWNPRIIQFTADDIGAKYDEIKGLPDGAYERLKQNIERLATVDDIKVRVNLRIHFDQKKSSDICYKLLDEFKNYSNVMPYVRLLYENTTVNDYKELLKIEDWMLNNLKIHPELSFPSFTPGIHCMADNVANACITPTGELSPCEHFAYGEYLYGSIYSGKKDLGILRKWRAREKYQEEMCDTCPLYPACRKIVMCPAKGICSKGYQYYQIEQIKRALRKKVKTLGNQES